MRVGRGALAPARRRRGRFAVGPSGPNSPDMVAGVGADIPVVGDIPVVVDMSVIGTREGSPEIAVPAAVEVRAEFPPWPAAFPACRTTDRSCPDFFNLLGSLANPER